MTRNFQPSTASSSTLTLDRPTARPLPTVTRTRIVAGELRVEEAEVLTPREAEILAEVAAGFPPKVVADRLFLSHHTVRNHLKSVYRKLGVQNRTQAILAAYRLGLADLEEVAS